MKELATKSDSLPTQSMTESFAKNIDFHVTTYGRTPEEARRVLTAEIDDEWVAKALAAPVDKIIWGHLARLTASGHAEVAEQLWSGLLDKASADLASGKAAANLIHEVSDTPLARAGFMALRAGLLAEWNPRGLLESNLVDQVAQALTLQSYWLQAHCSFAGTFGRPGRDQLPRLEEAEAAGYALQMMERFNKMALRLLRIMRDLRRMSAPVTVKNAGQVNVGQQQVNLG